jgi:hypothetical protein
MSSMTLPISMLASKGKGGVLAASVIGLLILLAIAGNSDPTARNQTVKR